MMRPVQFAGVTHVVLRGVNHEVGQAYEERDRQRSEAFQQAVEAEMDRMEDGNPGHRVSAFPLNTGYEAIVLDGDHLERYPQDLFQEHQTLLAAESALSGQSGFPEINQLSNVHKADAFRPVTRFNWTHRQDRNHDYVRRLAEDSLKQRLAQEADRAGSVVDVVI